MPIIRTNHILTFACLKCLKTHYRAEQLKKSSGISQIYNKNNTEIKSLRLKVNATISTWNYALDSSPTEPNRTGKTKTTFAYHRVDHS